MIVAGFGMTSSNISRQPEKLVAPTPTERASSSSAQQSPAVPVSGTTKPAVSGSTPIAQDSLETPGSSVINPTTTTNETKGTHDAPTYSGVEPSSLPIPHAPDSAPHIDLLAPPTLQNGQSVYDYDLKVLESSGQPWRKPGSDLSQWFNYGFDEESWQVYLRWRKGMVMGREAMMNLPPDATHLPYDVAAMLHLPQAAGAGMDGGNEMQGAMGNMNQEMMQHQMQEMMMQQMMGMGGMPGMPGMNPEMMQQMMGMSGMMPGMNGMQGMNGMGGMPPGFPPQPQQHPQQLQMQQPQQPQPHPQQMQMQQQQPQPQQLPLQQHIPAMGGECDLYH